VSIKSTSLMIIVMCAICTFAQAQPAAASKTKAVPLSGSGVCYATFNTALPNFCVTQNGNIENFLYPAGVSQIFTDGYGVCDATFSNTSYYDVGVADTGNWQNSIITEPGGANTLPLTIKRTTSDGIWTITQVFSRNTADAYVKVAITLKNNTAIGRTAWMTRYVDIDADGFASTNWFDGTVDSGWGYNAESAAYPNHGLTIRSNPSVHNLFGFSAPSGVYDPCGFVNNPMGTPTQGDEAVIYLWAPNGNSSVPAGKSITVTLEYRPM
jgi:hypothetical protein